MRNQGLFNEPIECPDCHEVNPPLTVRCARCGHSLESDEERATRLAAIEQSRRAAERENANYPRLRRDGSFNLGRSVNTMSNQRFRRILMVVVAIIAVVLVLSIVG